MSTSGWRRLDVVNPARRFWREHSLEFPDLFWLGWAAAAGAVLAEVALLIELVLPSTYSPSFVRLIFLWPIWLAIILSDVLFTGNLFHGTGLKVVLFAGIIGGMIGAGVAALGTVPVVLRFQRRPGLDFLMTLGPIWLIGLVLTLACWSLVASAEPFASDQRAEVIRQSIERQEPSAEWHRAIRRISTQGYTVDVDTLINPVNQQAAMPICAAVTNATVADPIDIRKLHVSTRWVRAVDGEVLCGGSG